MSCEPRPGWISHLHQIRRQEIARVFRGFPKEAFNRALELGAGDGFQSGLLRQYARTVVSTDYRQEPPSAVADGTVVPLQCDAERLGETLTGQSFDLVFSSNMMEHIPDPQRVLSGVREVLGPGGLSIHIMPNLVWKASHLLLHMPNLARREWTVGDLERLAARLRRGNAGDGPRPNLDNPKSDRLPSRSLGSRIAFPDPHGVSPRNLDEFWAFRRARWRRGFEAADFELLKTVKGPYASGYGFRLD